MVRLRGNDGEIGIIYHKINSKSIHLLIDQVPLQIEDHVPHLVVVADVVGGQNVHPLSVLMEGTSVLGLHRLLLLVAQRGQPAEETDQSVVEEELHEGNYRNYHVERQIKFLVKFCEVPLENGQSHGQLIRIDVGVSHQHPAPN